MLKSATIFVAKNVWFIWEWDGKFLVILCSNMYFFLLIQHHRSCSNADQHLFQKSTHILFHKKQLKRNGRLNFFHKLRDNPTWSPRGHSAQTHIGGQSKKFSGNPWKSSACSNLARSMIFAWIWKWVFWHYFSLFARMIIAWSSLTIIPCYSYSQTYHSEAWLSLSSSAKDTDCKLAQVVQTSYLNQALKHTQIILKNESVSSLKHAPNIQYSEFC